VLYDVKLPEGNGVDFVKDIKPFYSSAELVCLQLIAGA
jgi:hypothetical protein